MSAAAVRVRLATPADSQGIIALERATVEAPHWTEAEYEAMMLAPAGTLRRCLFVADSDARLLGFAVGKLVGALPQSFAELESVVVAVEARRAGVGRAVCQAVIDWSRMQAAEVIELEVRSSSAGAIALYLGLGFVVVGQRPAYYTDPEDDALLMRLHLAACG